MCFFFKLLSLEHKPYVFNYSIAYRGRGVFEIAYRKFSIFALLTQYLVLLKLDDDSYEHQNIC